jgi:hypothetical protein
MRCRDFSAVLRTFANVLDVAGAPVARDQIVMFSAVFDAHATSSVSDLAKRIAAIHGAESAGGPSLSDIARLLSALTSFLNKTAKATVLTDISVIEELLRDRASMGIGAFVRMVTEAAVPPGPTRKRNAPGSLDSAPSNISPRRPTRKRDAPKVRDDLVVHYKEKLEAALGDEEKFTAVYNDLRANTAIGKPEIIALAKQMTGSGARTEDAALKKIWNRHQSLMVFKAKSRATGGRSAA